MKVKSESEVTQSCPTLRDLMDYSLPGSSIHGIFQARVLEWGAIKGLMLKLKLQYYCLENPMDGGAWWAAVHGLAKRQTQLSDFTFTFHSHALEKEMATHSSVLAWRIPGMVEPGGLPSMGVTQSQTRLK